MNHTKPIANDWVAYVGPIDFPEGGAATRRVLGISQSLCDVGYRVTVVSGYLSANRAEGESVAVEPGIESVQVNERSAEHLPKWLRFARYFTMGRRSRSWFEQQSEWPKAIIIYSGYSPYLLSFTRWAKKRGIKIIFDAVEWYAAESWLGFITSPYLMNTEFAMRYLIPKTDGVICISRALQDYYDGRKVPTVRVPPTLSILPKSTTETLGPFDSDNVALVKGDGPIRLVYAGTPGKKDRLDKIATAVKQLNSQQISDGLDRRQPALELHVVGMNEVDLINYMRQSPESGVWDQQTLTTAGLVCHGQIPHADVTKLLEQAHYTIFIREINRVSTFGFPTKYVESVAFGCPVITNITTDLGQFHHAKTGIVIPSTEVADIEASLMHAMSLSESQYYAQKEQAYQVAIKYFDVAQYAKPLKQFIQRLS
ncbi:glycosyltransferase [Pseudidiomarina sp. PP-1MA]|uniref:Glycosyltransferase n=1 Tax=Pseudidiomarina sp. PP-1MA TaxID=3237706 RepID=A0AB39X9W8_9GAMM